MPTIHIKRLLTSFIVVLIRGQEGKGVRHRWKIDYALRGQWPNLSHCCPFLLCQRYYAIVPFVNVGSLQWKVEERMRGWPRRAGKCANALSHFCSYPYLPVHGALKNVGARCSIARWYGGLSCNLRRNNSHRHITADVLMMPDRPQQHPTLTTLDSVTNIIWKNWSTRNPPGGVEAKWPVTMCAEFTEQMR